MEKTSSSNTKNILLICIESPSMYMTNQQLLKEIDNLIPFFGEVHVSIFTPGRLFKKIELEKKAENVWFYYTSNNILTRKVQFNNIINKHLLWQKKFRPSRILSYGMTSATSLASLSSKKFYCPHYIKVLISDRVNIKTRIVHAFRNAYRVYIEGPELYKKITKTIGQKKSHVVELTPCIDFEYIKSQTDSIDFTKTYKKDFFFISHMSHFEKVSIVFLCKLMTKLKKQYFKSGFILFTQKKYIKKIRRIIKSFSLAETFFVEEERENMLPVYRSSRVYISAMKKDSINLPVLYALASSVPVISTQTGYAEKLYTNTPFSKYLCEYGDIDSFYNKIKLLIENSHEWNDFKVNSSSLLVALPHESKEESISKLAFSINQELNQN